MGRVVGDQLAQPIHMSVGHLQHAPDVAANRPRLQLAEGDDLRDAVPAVFLLDIADHLIAPVLAEIDVEVGHRHAFGIEEALEQQIEAQGIEIGDRQRISHERAGARAATGPHRNAVRLGKFDEVGNDEEIAGKIHADDDVELELEPRLIILTAVALNDAVHREPFLQSLACLHPELLGLVALGCKPRQDRIGGDRPEGASSCDLDRILDRLGDIGKEPNHVARRFEIMFRR
jgi:hypothetical protein